MRLLAAYQAPAKETIFSSSFEGFNTRWTLLSSPPPPLPPRPPCLQALKRWPVFMNDAIIRLLPKLAAVVVRATVAAVMQRCRWTSGSRTFSREDPKVFGPLLEQQRPRKRLRHASFVEANSRSGGFANRFVFRFPIAADIVASRLLSSLSLERPTSNPGKGMRGA